MNGKKVKEIIRSEGLTIEEVAVALGYSNAQRLHSALKSDDVKSGLLENIAKATNRSVGIFYGLQTEPTESKTPSTNNHDSSDKLFELLSQKEASLAKAQEHIDKLLAIIGNPPHAESL
ncbi:MAG: hypothetical protein NC324_02715 [Bacteroides sp.]|nr:hypothetical protein [Bacteroides sp.]